MQNNIPNFTSPFKKELEEFIIYKRNIGYKYSLKTCEIFKQLDTFLGNLNQKEPHIDQNVIDNWIKEYRGNSNFTRMRYYSTISMFCKFLVTKNYSNVAIPMEQHFRNLNKFIPYIYSSEEINKIFNCAQTKIKTNDLRYMIFYIILCLLYGCGLILSEAVYLKYKDFKDGEKLLIIENSKNDISRIVPLSDSIYSNLKHYISFINPLSEEEYLFTYKKQVINKRWIRWLFHKILLEVKIPPLANGNRQRLHDFRHTFAVNALIQMEEKNFDLYTTLPMLSTYLGHYSIRSTEYYLRLIKRENNKINNKINTYTKNIYLEKEIYKYE